RTTMPATSRDRNSYHNISVYNFGIESAEIANELALLRQFRDLYSIDQVIFYTGLLALPTKAWLQLSPPGRQRKPGFYLFGENKYRKPGFICSEQTNIARRSWLGLLPVRRFQRIRTCCATPAA